MALLEFSGGGATISRCWISDVIPSILGASSPRRFFSTRNIVVGGSRICWGDAAARIGQLEHVHALAAAAGAVASSSGGTADTEGASVVDVGYFEAEHGASEVGRHGGDVEAVEAGFLGAHGEL